ncbi:protein O-mannosyl-transferase TMTC3 [Caerostris extrusa]|uniref:Protein O-mannosyl-transferase TMTC3 n=1 Tax=Caerostris extrusa TaxID=172846 RepID=A0AAV4RKC9_CAEEX|nr:protein O-mannosyl-transferase TMTC3 [Caerostris extrusa]
MIHREITMIIMQRFLTKETIPLFLSRFDNPAAVSDFPTRQLTYNYLLAVNTWLLLFPYYLCCDWTMSTIPLVSSLWDARNIATIAVYLALFYVVKVVVKLDDETKMTLLMGLLLVVIPFLPASNLLFPVGFVVAERVLFYIPSMGFCMLVAQGWSRLFEKRYRHWAILGITFILIVNACKTIIRNKDCWLVDLLFLHHAPGESYVLCSNYGPARNSVGP